MKQFIRRTALAASLCLSYGAALANTCVPLQAGATDQTVYVEFIDESTGVPTAALAFDTSGIDLEYVRSGAAAAEITEATQTAAGAHSDGGFVSVGHGRYRLDLPDAAVASGVPQVVVQGVITGYIMLPCVVHLNTSTPQTGDSFARLGAPAGASISADIAAVEAQTDDIGAAGAGLTAIDLPNQTMDITGTLSTVTSVTNIVTANATQISGDSAAADALELAFDGTATGARLFGVDRWGTAAAVAAGSITLDAGAAYGDNSINGATVWGCGSTQGYCQFNSVASSSGDVLTLASNWAVTPSGTVTFYLWGVPAASGGGGDATAANQTTILANIATIDTIVDAILVDTGTTLDDLVDDIESRLGVPSNLGGGATLSANASDIEAQTDDIGTAGAGLTAADDAVITLIGVAGAGLTAVDDAVLARLPAALISGRMASQVGGYESGMTPLQPTVAGRTLDVTATGGAGIDWANVESPTTALGLTGTTISTAQVAASVTGNVGGNVIGFVGSVNTNGISAASLAPDAGTELGTAIWAATTRELTSGLNIVLAKGTGVTGFNDLSAAQVNAEVDSGIETYNLHRLFNTAYDPASKPGDAAGLLNVIVENDAGVPRFTTNVLENGPAGGGGGSSDWSVGEREQLRHRFGIDGAATAPSATPSLASAAAITALNNLSATQLRDLVIEDQGGGVTLGCAIAVILSYAAGDLVTTGTTSVYEETSGTETRISGTVPSSGNRTASITCPSY